MSGLRQLPFSRRRVQRGGMSVTMMLVMLGLVGMLGLIEIGYLYWAKRDVQKTADLAALAGAQRLDLCSADRADNAAARANAVNANRFPGTLRVQCGDWNPAHTTEDNFAAVSPAAPPNAVKVVAERSVLPFLGQNQNLPTVRAQAVATRAPPFAVLSVGSQLLRVNGNTPLGGVLKLVGVDLDQTTLLGYDGLAQVKVTPKGLLEALEIPVKADISIGEFNALLAANKVSLGRLVEATATVLSQSGVAHADLDALQNALAAKLDVDRLAIQLGSNDAASGLFGRIVAPDGPATAALDAQVNALDLLTTAISIANSGRAVEVSQLNVLGVQAKAAIIEPPSIAIGGVGTRAYNAQVRLFLDIDSNNLALGLGKVLTALGIRLRLPIHADVTNAMATVTSLQCSAIPATATVQVDSSVLRACVGKVAEADRFSTRNVCEASLQNEQLLTLLGAPLINDRIQLNALSHSENLTLAAGETKSTWINPAQIGTAVSDLVQQLLRVLGGMLNPAAKGMNTASTADQLADQFLKASNPGNGVYDVDRTIALLRNGNPAQGISAFGDWQVHNGVPYACVLGLGTCYKDGSVWEGYRATVTGQGLGLLDGVLGTLLGGLVINRCSGLVSALLAYNACVKGNLASYMQTAPAGVLDAYQGSGSVTDPGTNTVACSGLLCTLLRPVLEGVLKPLLNGVGTLLTATLATVLGIELGRTDVHLQATHCNPAQLVY
ncbi:TadG family pilus assembly protein [Stenotrophomonas oahuensis]|uniref:TadG family pilus assembly protein n=1 Tax=Stenotrophomonas oahuensis TaxID=3003271 RepID=A0ABY9YN89_9GAMM|nr:TadG family pilus assembly protein [Stenotrophomonas sp. A5586]WNH52360.1 TadG family pilus assembly protein [Stenotrophomonas sp. A5586]